MVHVNWRSACRAATWLLACAALLVGCGGGVDSGGTGNGIYASGPITGYGSIVVGGVHYDESTADVQDDDGTPRTAADLQLGMVTEIQASAPMGSASMPTATAMAVRYRSEIIGPVSAVSTSTSTLKVLGQTVKVTAKTVFDARIVGGLAGLKANDVVEVYGELDTRARSYTATRIEPRPADTAAFKLRGLVTAVDTVAGTLGIGGQAIDVSAIAALPEIIAGRTLLRVTLKPQQVAGLWVATAVEVGARRVPDREYVELEGRITAFKSITSFEVDGVPVVTTSSTVFPDGPAAIVLGVRVEAQGRSLDGQLVAMKVTVQSDSQGGAVPFEISGSIANGSLDTVAQTFVVRGFTVHWSATTSFDAGSAANLRAGRRVAVKGALSADGTRLEAASIRVQVSE